MSLEIGGVPGSFPKLGGYRFEGRHYKDHSVWGSILGSPSFGKLSHFGVIEVWISQDAPLGTPRPWRAISPAAEMSG